MSKSQKPNRSLATVQQVERSLAEREVELERLVAKAAEVFERGTPENTRSAYASDWKNFRNWALEWGYCAVDERGPIEPIKEEVVLLYMTHLVELGRKVKTIERALFGIAAVQRYRHPEIRIYTEGVKRYMSKIKSATGDQLRQAAALLPDDLKRIVSAMTLAGSDAGLTPLALRDRALMLVGWAGAFRRSELAGLDRRNIRRTPEGLVLRLDSSKTDKERQGVDVAILRAENADLCPVSALEEWLTYVGDHPCEHVFCRADHHKLFLEQRMPERQLRRVFERWVRLAQLTAPSAREKYSPHSLRAGFITTAAMKNVPDAAIMGHSRHKDHRVFMGYVRRARPFDNHPGKGLI